MNFNSIWVQINILWLLFFFILFRYFFLFFYFSHIKAQIFYYILMSFFSGKLFNYFWKKKLFFKKKSFVKMIKGNQENLTTREKWKTFFCTTTKQNVRLSAIFIVRKTRKLDNKHNKLPRKSSWEVCVCVCNRGKMIKNPKWAASGIWRKVGGGFLLHIFFFTSMSKSFLPSVH